MKLTRIPAFCLLLHAAFLGLSVAAQAQADTAQRRFYIPRPGSITLPVQITTQTDTFPGAAGMVPMYSTVTTKTTVTTTTVVYGSVGSGTYTAPKTDTLARQVIRDTVYLKSRRQKRQEARKDSLVRVQGLFATLTIGPGVNRAGSPVRDGPNVAFPQRLGQGLSKAISLTYTRPQGFLIGVTLGEMRKSTPLQNNAVNASRFRYGGLLMGGRMASPKNYNVQFLLAGGLVLASQRYLLLINNNEVEIASNRFCLMLRPQAEVRLMHNLQLVGGVQAVASFSDREYKVLRTDDRMLYFQQFSDGTVPFFYYDLHVGLSYQLVR